MPQATSVKWTREHELIALNLYGKLPFGKFDKGNSVIIDVASRMGRTPSSLAMKLSNLASLDPVQKARGIRGLSGASKQDREMWNEFHSKINDLAAESEQLLHDLFTDDDELEVDFLERDKVRLEPSRLTPPSGATETIASVRVRRGQQFFRQTVLNSYGVRCCISGIMCPAFLWPAISNLGETSQMSDLTHATVFAFRVCMMPLSMRVSSLSTRSCELC